MELRQVRTFLEVSRAGTVGAAAVTLGLAPSSVSEQVRALERSLGVVLFDRGPSGMRLTEAGLRLRPRAEQLVGLAERVRREVCAPGDPQVRLGALETLAAVHVPAVLARAERRRPDLRVRVESHRARDLMLTQVQVGDLDAALLLDVGDGVGALGFAVPAGGALAHTDLEPVPVELVAAARHPLVSHGPVGPEQVRSFPRLVTPPGCSFRMSADLVLGPGGECTEVGGVALARSWAVHGLGSAVLPRFAVVDELAGGSLVRVPFTGRLPDLRLRLVWRADRESDRDVRDLLYAVAHAAAGDVGAAGGVRGT